MRTPCSHLSTIFVFCVRSPKNCPNGYRTAVPPLGGRVQRTKLNYAIQRTDTSVQATRMHCIDHKHSIHNVKVCSSFRWIKQYTHLSVAKLLIESNSFYGWYQRWVYTAPYTCIRIRRSMHVPGIMHLYIYCTCTYLGLCIQCKIYNVQNCTVHVQYPVHVT